jgi:predicted RNA methylase
MDAINSMSPGSSRQAYYTSASGILDVMAALLGDVTDLNVLEPAVGGGAFLDILLGKPARVDAIDVDEDCIRRISEAGLANVNAKKADFIDLFVDGALQRNNVLLNVYDAAIANPPYGLKIPLPFRKKIKKLYPNVYARESYGLFLHFTLSMLKNNGRYVFIIPDTFLQSVYHKPLRAELARSGAPTHIIQFNSKRFETVNFGYGKLCIIAGNVSPLLASDAVFWRELNDGDRLDASVLELKSSSVSGRTLLDGIERGWTNSGSAKFKQPSDWSELGDLAECRTGIYSGDNQRFFAFKMNEIIRRPIGNPIDWAAVCHTGPLTDDEKENGIDGARCYIPLIRGGHRAPLDDVRTAIDWSRDAVTYYRNDPKARLQNSRFYFRKGLAIPMVTSGRLTASLMQDAVFDQGVVGIFPHDPDFLAALLIYFNSDFVSSNLKGGINSSANNSANYLKRLPVPCFSPPQLAEAEKIVRMAQQTGWDATKVEREAFMQRLTI